MYDGLHDAIRDFRNRDQQAAWSKPVHLSDFVDHPAMEHAGNEWYLTSRIISHACGGIDGLDYSNSKEALEQTIAKGVRAIEVDFCYTSDGALVCAHEWTDFHSTDEAPSLDTFLSAKMYGKYTTMHAESVIEAMKAHDDLYIIIDTKESDAVGIVRDLVALCEGNDDVISRFVIQLYQPNVKQDMLAIYPFGDQNFLFTAYKFGPSRVAEIMDLCYREGVRVVTVSKGSWDSEILNQFREKQIYVFEHTINRPDHANEALERGVYGVYTDFLTEEDLRY